MRNDKTTYWLLVCALSVYIVTALPRLISQIKTALGK